MYAVINCLDYEEIVKELQETIDKLFDNEVERELVWNEVSELIDDGSTEEEIHNLIITRSQNGI